MTRRCCWQELGRQIKAGLQAGLCHEQHGNHYRQSNVARLQLDHEHAIVETKRPRRGTRANIDTSMLQALLKVPEKGNMKSIGASCSLPALRAARATNGHHNCLALTCARLPSVGCCACRAPRPRGLSSPHRLP